MGSTATHQICPLVPLTLSHHIQPHKTKNAVLHQRHPLQTTQTPSWRARQSVYSTTPSYPSTTNCRHTNHKSRHHRLHTHQYQDVRHGNTRPEHAASQNLHLPKPCCLQSLRRILSSPPRQPRPRIPPIQMLPNELHGLCSAAHVQSWANTRPKNWNHHDRLLLANWPVPIRHWLPPCHNRWVSFHH